MLAISVAKARCIDGMAGRYMSILSGPRATRAARNTSILVESLGYGEADMAAPWYTTVGASVCFPRALRKVTASFCRGVTRMARWLLILGCLLVVSGIAL